MLVTHGDFDMIISKCKQSTRALRNSSKIISGLGTHLNKQICRYLHKMGPRQHTAGMLVLAMLPPLILAGCPFQGMMGGAPATLEVPAARSLLQVLRGSRIGPCTSHPHSAPNPRDISQLQT